MKIHFMLSAALIVGLAGASAQAADAQFKVVKSTRLGAMGDKSGNVINATPFYSNITTFLGSGFAFGATAAGQSQPAGGTGLLTAMGCDDVTLQPGDPNGSYALNELTFSIANFNTITVDTAPTLLFYNPDGAVNPVGAPLNGPGTLIDGIAFNLVGQLPAGSVSQLSATVGTLGIAFPLDANGEATIWVCAMFDDDNGTALDENSAPVTAAQYDNLGVGLCDPPTVGSSIDDLFLSDAPVVAPFANPIGGQGNFGGDPVANTCLELAQ